MQRGLYIAAAGMQAEVVRQDVIANDLANVSTPGYKVSRPTQASFGDMLLANRQDGAPIGALTLGAEITSLEPDMTQGPLRDTGETLDLAISGAGFLEVDAPGGVRYTRNGQLALDAQGRLITAATGLIVRGTDGNPITIDDQSTTEIAPDGTVTVAGRQVGAISLVAIENPDKEGESLFSGTPAGRPEETVIRQGFLEGGASDATRAMVDMVVSLRAYESGQRVIRAIDESLARGVQSGATTP